MGWRLLQILCYVQTIRGVTVRQAQLQLPSSFGIAEAFARNDDTGD
jgi:hypothetical protein